MSNPTECTACDKLAEEEATGAPRSAETDQAILDNPTHIVRTNTGGSPSATELTDFQQAERDYVPVHQAYLAGDENRFELWDQWLGKWGDRFSAVCHDVYNTPSTARYGF